MRHINNQLLASRYLLYLSVILFFTVEIFNKIYLRNNSMVEVSYGSYIRGVIFFIFLFFYFSKFNVDFKVSILILVFALVIISARVFTHGFGNMNSFLNSLGRYLSLPIFLYVLKYGYFDKTMILRASVLIVGFAIINTLISIFGLLFNIPFFATYGSNRFGYDGVFFWANDATTFQIIATIISWVIYSRFKSICFLLSTLFIIVGGLLLGTKAYWLFLCLLFIIILYVNLRTALKFLLIVTPFAIIIILISHSYFGELVSNRGWLYALTSSRNLRVDLMREIVTSMFTTFNFLFGTGEIKAFLSETDLLDLFYYSGLSGLFLYFAALFYLLRDCRPNSIIKWLLVSIILVISFTAGHFIGNGSNSIYLAILLALLFYNENHYRVHLD